MFAIENPVKPEALLGLIHNADVLEVAIVDLLAELGWWLHEREWCSIDSAVAARWVRQGVGR